MKTSYLAILLLFVSLCAANGKVQSIKEGDRKPIFLNKIKVKNPKAQEAVNQLKEDFYNEKESINRKYERKIKELKKNRRNEIKNLKSRYKNKLKRLRSQYPEIPDISIGAKPKPKPTPPGIDSDKPRKRKKRERIKKERIKEQKIIDNAKKIPYEEKSIPEGDAPKIVPKSKEKIK